jgi:hypothetical protein
MFPHVGSSCIQRNMVVHLVLSEKVASVINYSSEKIGLLEKILILILILEMLPNCLLELR